VLAEARSEAEADCLSAGAGASTAAMCRCGAAGVGVLTARTEKRACSRESSELRKLVESSVLSPLG
jgi:hypothetical protein